MIKVVVFDVDFTLTSEIDGTIPASTIEAIKQLREKGIKVVVASGRIIASLVYKLAHNQIDYDYLLGACGAQVVDKDLNPIYLNCMDCQIVEDLTKKAQEENFGMYWKYVDDGYVYGNKESFAWYCAEGNYINVTDEPGFDKLPNGGGIIAPKHVVAEILNKYADKIDIVYGGLTLHDLNSKGINKAVGLQALSKAINIDLSEFMAFGDSDNDREMLQVCGLSVAMGNGVDTLKKIADYTTDKVSEDGIMNALKKFNIL